jgi:large subunit ribosomal protein L9
MFSFFERIAMPSVKIYLLKDFPSLGAKGSVLQVSDGYANNFLIPKGVASLYDRSAEQKVISEKKKLAQDKVKKTALTQSISNLIVKIYRVEKEPGLFYGSVSAKDIVDELKSQHSIALNKYHIALVKPLRSFGNHDVSVSLSKTLSAKLKVSILKAKK